jgi:hypothetical protein
MCAGQAKRIAAAEILTEIDSSLIDCARMAAKSADLEFRSKQGGKCARKLKIGFRGALFCILFWHAKKYEENGGLSRLSRD